MAKEADKLEKLRKYHALVEQVMSIAEKETIEDVARLLATRVGY